MIHHRIRILIFALTAMPFVSGCAVIPFGIGLIPGAPSYISSIIGNGQSAYEIATDERDSEQQMLDAIVAGHAQAELYKDKEIRPDQILAYCYFGKLYLVGEYDSQAQLRTIYECMEKVENKKMVISCLYLTPQKNKQNYLEKQAMYLDLKTQLVADFQVTSAPVEVEIIQGDIVLLGVIADPKERDRIMAHALNTPHVNRVISYLYHNENAGPKPRTMTARLSPKRSRLATSKTQSHAQPETARKHHARQLINPDRGR